MSATTTALGGSTTPDWARVRDRIDRLDWAATISSAVHTEAADWRERLRIPLPALQTDPSRQTEWSHFYYCDDDGSRLTFVADSPTEHRCPSCGRTYRGEPKDGAWRTQLHNQAAAQAQRDALIVRIGTDQDGASAALTELEMIITGYGDAYHDHAPHGRHAGIGRVLPQSLDEAIWAIGLLRAARWTDAQLSQRARQAADTLAGGVAELLRPQVGAIHNIHCWMLAALAECAIRLGDQELLDFTSISEFGANAQLQQGFRHDGLWYEVNPHYHYYTVSALLAWLEAVGRDNVASTVGEILEKAIAAPPQLAYSDGLLPAYGDGWSDARVSTFAAVAETASFLIPDAGVALDGYYAEHQPRSSVAALLFGPDELPVAGTVAPESFCWTDAGIAVLRSPATRITLRSGPDAGGHDHHDKLAVDIETASGWRSLDLGTSGYGADFTVWLRSPAAHSTVFVGGRPQPPCDGSITAFSPRNTVGEAGWEGCRLQREITLTDDGWTDTFTVELDHEDEITWVLHGDGIVLTGAATPVAAAPDGLAGLGLDRLHDLRLLDQIDDQLRIGWEVDDAPQGVVTVPAGFAVYAGEGDGNPSGRPLGTVIITGRAASAVITGQFASS